MTEEELYAALIRLCQAYGVTSEETYARLREAVETIAENVDENTDYLYPPPGCPSADCRQWDS